MPGFERAIPEIKVYWEESFGSYERIDYGTGHELNFVAFLFCLRSLALVNVYHSTESFELVTKYVQKSEYLRDIDLSWKIITPSY